MKYALGHAFTAPELYQHFNIKKLKVHWTTLKKLFNDPGKPNLCYQVFAKSVEFIVNDIIENRVQVQLPSTRKIKPYLFMKRTEGEKFKEAFRHGKWRDVDFVNTFFTGYSLGLFLSSTTSGDKIKDIHVNKEIQKRITEKTNEGVSY